MQKFMIVKTTRVKNEKPIVAIALEPISKVSFKKSRAPFSNYNFFHSICEDWVKENNFIEKVKPLSFTLSTKNFYKFLVSSKRDNYPISNYPIEVKLDCPTLEFLWKNNEFFKDIYFPMAKHNHIFLSTFTGKRPFIVDENLALDLISTKESNVCPMVILPRDTEVKKIKNVKA